LTHIRKAMQPERPSEIDYHLFTPAARVPGRLLCCVHGVTSSPADQIQALVPLSAAHGIPVLAPEFPRPDYKGYQRLASIEEPLGAAHAFHGAVTDALGRMGSGTVPVDMMGFSGGAQFIHRYAMLFPQRVRRLVVAAAGWYTYLDPEREFPHGIAPSELSGGRAVQVAEFLRIPIRVMIGERDVERDTQLRSTRMVDRQQGKHRLERAIRWVEHLRHDARSRGIDADISLELLPRVGHSFREAMARARYGQRTFAFLDGAEPAARESA
jgi:pimeloyl-ACP methyl ester carboxylesterase